MDKKQILIYGGIAVVSAGTGFAVGHILAKKKYQRLADEEINSVREMYVTQNNSAVKPDIEEVMAELAHKREVLTTHEAIVYNEGYNPQADDTDANEFRRIHGRVPTTHELIQMGEGIEPEDALILRNSYDHDDAAVFERNIFENPVPDEDEDPSDEGVPAEVPESLEIPYIIDDVSWFTNNTDFSQVSLTYWADDAVLTNSANQIVSDVTVVGEVNLHRFGTKSNDPDIVYVRNHDEKTDFEITKVEKNYSVEILKVPAEDDSPRIRKMRSNDD